MLGKVRLTTMWATSQCDGLFIGSHTENRTLPFIWWHGAMIMRTIGSKRTREKQNTLRCVSRKHRTHISRCAPVYCSLMWRNIAIRFAIQTDPVLRVTSYDDNNELKWNDICARNGMQVGARYLGDSFEQISFAWLIQCGSFHLLGAL